MVRYSLEGHVKEDINGFVHLGIATYIIGNSALEQIVYGTGEENNLMTKAKKVDLKSFGIIQVENGWELTARSCSDWYDFKKDELLKTYVFTDMDDLLIWIESNI